MLTEAWGLVTSLYALLPEYSEEVNSSTRICSWSVPREAEVFALKRFDNIVLLLNRFKTRLDPRSGSQVIVRAIGIEILTLEHRPRSLFIYFD